MSCGVVGMYRDCAMYGGIVGVCGRIICVCDGLGV